MRVRKEFRIHESEPSRQGIGDIFGKFLGVGYSLLLLMFGWALVACTSPEARRTRGGGPGADVGNRSTVVEIHAGAQPYYQTPCRKPMNTC